MYALGYDVSNPELSQLLREVGANPNEQIDFNDFYNVLVHKMTSLETRIESTRAFKWLDEDNKGYIGIEDLREIANSLHMDLTDDELVEMILFAHPLSDGSVGTASAGGVNMTEFDAKEALVVREDDFLKLMKRANVYK
ncbi:centrin [Strigomonas culicis]|uniref:Centrin n=1 Tax=Strigomonas culicis TaxID=28005 RepID=S9USG3_9TRYP|nr:centrin [Strigomonas culicis]|eukprot:EPY31729.1 centrin [Strigomonas culicis]